MNVCGVSAQFHDAAAALVVDGQVVAAAQEERFSRRKGDPSVPSAAFAWCLEQGGLRPDDLDAVVFYEKPFRKFFRIIASTVANAPFGFAAFRGAMHTWFERKLWIRGELARTFGVPHDLVVFCDHHLSHAAAAFLTQPLDSAATLVVDGVGEWMSTSIGRLRRDGAGLHHERLASVDFPHSLGLLYSALTAFLGFRVNEGEYKLMGLAPYGRPRLLGELRQLVRHPDDGTFRLDLSYFAHDRSVQKGWSSKLERLLGPPNPPHRVLGSDVPGHDWQRFADIAASLQALLEEELLRLVRLASELTGERVLCYGGGVALNAVANGKLARSGEFERVLVHPASGDAGGALGAALAWAATHESALRPGRFTPYLGVEVPASSSAPGSVRTPLASVAPGSAPGAGDITWQRAGDEAQFCEWVAQELADDRVVGLVAGRAEWGPRALGARSILARPDSPGQCARLNRLVKEREDFRPFAPVVLEQHADELFEGFSPGRTLERHMLGTVTTRQAWRERLAATTHVDGSARVQLLGPHDAPLLHGVLTRFHALTGLPALLNTSFNHAGEPIVNDLADALASARRCRLDVLAVYPWVGRLAAQASPSEDEMRT